MNLRFRFGRRQSVAPSSSADSQSCSNSRYATAPHFAPGPVRVLVVHRIFSAPYIVGADAATIRLSDAVKQKTLLAVVPRPVQTKDSNLFRLLAKLARGMILGSTALRYRKTCDKYIKNAAINKKSIEKITRKEWTRFLQDIYDAGSPTEEDPNRRITAKELGRIKYIVKGILNRAEDEDLITYTADDVISHVRTDVNGFRHTTSTTEEEVYYPDEYKLLKSYCLSNPDPYTRCILLSMNTGERIGECTALFAEDINLEERYILVRRTETQADATGKQMETVREGAKTKAGIRRVAIPDSALEWVREIKEIAEKTGGGYLFKQEPGRFKKRYVGNRVRASQVRRHLRTICAELNIPYRPPHKFRKTYASILNAADVDDAMIIDQIGHTNINFTKNVYIKDRNRMKERSRMLGEIDELRLDPLEEENPNCKVICFFGESPESHPGVTRHLQKKTKPEKAFK